MSIPSREARAPRKPRSSSPPHSEGQRERNKREKLARIKRAARQLFEKQGFEATTARQICERAGIGTGTLFLYARDKRELLFLIFEEEAQRLFAEGSLRAEKASSLVDALMLLFGGFIDFYAKNPDLSKLILQEIFYQRQDQGGIGELNAQYEGCIAALIERAQQRGEIEPSLSPSVAALACFAHYVFWLQSWLGARMVSERNVRSGLRAALELQIQGLRPKRQRARKKPGARAKRPAKKGTKAKSPSKARAKAKSRSGPKRSR